MSSACWSCGVGGLLGGGIWSVPLFKSSGTPGTEPGVCIVGWLGICGGTIAGAACPELLC